MASAVMAVVCALTISMFISYASTGIVCHGRGSLNYDMKCKCESEIFGGKHCEECNCVFGTCPEEGIGTFGSNNMCKCDDNWMGPLCDWCCATGTKQCEHVDSSSSQLQCIGSDCATNYYGPQCKKFCLPGRTCCQHYDNPDEFEECTKNAVCTDDGNCQCNNNYGWSFLNARCEACPKPCNQNTSLRCDTGPTCICRDGYYGPGCGSDCGCNQTGDKTLQRNGFCMPDNNIKKCTCNVDLNGQFKYLTYPADQKPYCNIACPISAENNLVCGGHGRCALNHSNSNTFGVCECEAGYEGLACDCTSDTCHSPRGQCRTEADANDKSRCICFGMWDEKTNCASCQANWYGQECNIFCGKTTCQNGAKCSQADGNCGHCPLNINSTIDYINVSKVLLYNLSNPTGLRKLLPPQECALNNGSVWKLMAGNARLITAPCNANAEINFDKIPVFAARKLFYQVFNATGCYKCNDDFYPDPQSTAPNIPPACSVFCNNAVCTYNGVCNATTTLCDCTTPHVMPDTDISNRTFCSLCTQNPDQGWQWGPEPHKPANESCVTYCEKDATSYLQCIQQGIEHKQLDEAAYNLTANGLPCDDGTTCGIEYNKSKPFYGQVMCIANGTSTLCHVPSPVDNNLDAINSTHTNYTFANGSQTFACNFCMGHGHCQEGSCNCGIERVSTDFDVMPTNRFADNYHGKHCDMTCTNVGSSTACSGHGVCAWNGSYTEKPFCVCDGGTISAAQWLLANETFTNCTRDASTTREKTRCHNPGKRPAPAYFGEYCEKSAPLFWYQRTLQEPQACDESKQDCIGLPCNGHPWTLTTTYTHIDRDGTNNLVYNKPCDERTDCCIRTGVDRGAKSEERNECEFSENIFCDTTAPRTTSDKKGICTKAECLCPGDLGQPNCAVYCRESIVNNCVQWLSKDDTTAPGARPKSYQLCESSACGEVVPIIPFANDSYVLYTSPCSRGRCMSVDSKRNGSFVAPAQNRGTIDGRCSCSKRERKPKPEDQANDNTVCNLYNNNPLKNPNICSQAIYMESCCGLADSYYGGGTDGGYGFCGQDCQCSTNAIDNNKGECTNPYSDQCVCNAGACGSDCDGTCPPSCSGNQDNATGTCISTGHNQCSCSCLGGYIQRTDGFFDVPFAPLYVGPACQVACFNNSAAIMTMTRPSWYTNASYQQKYLNQYLKEFNLCNNHGICKLGRAGAPACLCDATHGGEFCGASCFNANWWKPSSSLASQPLTPVPDDALYTAQTAYSKFGFRACNHGFCTVQGNSNVTQCQAKSRNFVTGSFSKCPVTDAKPCASNDVSDFVKERFLCPALNNISTNVNCLDCDSHSTTIPAQPGITDLQYASFSLYPLGIRAGNTTGTCSLCSPPGKTPPFTECAPDRFSSGDPWRYARSKKNATFGFGNLKPCRNDAVTTDDDMCLSKEVSLASRFALNRDCARSYTHDLQCAPGLYRGKTDYYWANLPTYELPHCVCDASNAYVANFNNVTNRKCTTCSLAGASSENKCLCPQYTYFLSTGVCSEKASTIGGAALQCAPIVNSEPYMLISTWPDVFPNARADSHTFCNVNKPQWSSCTNTSAIVLPLNNSMTVQQFTQTFPPEKNPLYGKFLCKPPLQTRAFGFNCVFYTGEQTLATYPANRTCSNWNLGTCINTNPSNVTLDHGCSAFTVETKCPNATQTTICNSSNYVHCSAIANQTYSLNTTTPPTINQYWAATPNQVVFTLSAGAEACKYQDGWNNCEITARTYDVGTQWSNFYLNKSSLFVTVGDYNEIHATTVALGTSSETTVPFCYNIFNGYDTGELPFFMGNNINDDSNVPVLRGPCPMPPSGQYIPLAAMAGFPPPFVKTIVANATQITKSAYQPAYGVAPPSANGASCYNVNEYTLEYKSPHIYTAKSPICAYLAMYGGFKSAEQSPNGNALLENSKNAQVYQNWCIENMDTEAINFFANPPGLLTGDSCRDMFLKTAAIDAAAKYAGMPGVDMNLGLRGAGDCDGDGGTCRFQGFVQGLDQAWLTDENPYQVQRDIAEDYYCNTTTFTCQFGRTHRNVAHNARFDFAALDANNNVQVIGVEVKDAIKPIISESLWNVAETPEKHTFKDNGWALSNVNNFPCGTAFTPPLGGESYLRSNPWVCKYDCPTLTKISDTIDDFKFACNKSQTTFGYAAKAVLTYQFDFNDTRKITVVSCGSAGTWNGTNCECTDPKMDPNTKCQDILQPANDTKIMDQQLYPDTTLAIANQTLVCVAGSTNAPA